MSKSLSLIAKLSRGYKPLMLIAAARLLIGCGLGESRSPGRGAELGTVKSALVPGGPLAVRSDQFVLGTDSALYRRYSDVSVEHGYQYLGNNGVTLVSDPAVASWGKGRADVFVINKNNTIDHGVQGDGDAFYWANNWGNPSGKGLRGIAASSGRAGLLDVFVVDVNSQPGVPFWNTLWHRRWDNGADTGWQQMSPPNFPAMFGKPAVAAGTLYPDSYDIFVTGYNLYTNRYNIYHAYSDFGSTIDGSENLGEPGGAALASDPGAASWSANRIDMVVTDAAGAIRHLFTDDLFNWSWNVWSAPKVTASPAIVTTGVNQLRVFAHSASDGSLLQCTWEGADRGCVSRGGVILGGPGATSWGSSFSTTYAATPSNPGGGGEWGVEWTNGLNGIAHDQANWYWSNKKNIYLIPLYEDIANRFGDWFVDYPSVYPGAIYFDGGWNQTGATISDFHLGDVDFYNCPVPGNPGCGHLFVPIELHTGEKWGQYLAIFNPAPDYHYPLELARQAQQMPLQLSFAWVAANPQDGFLYTATTFNNVSSLQTYRIAADLEVTPDHTIALKNYDGVTPLTLNDEVQGGAFSPSGYLYISVGTHDGTQGVYVFGTDGTLRARLDFSISSNWICNSIATKGEFDEEAEGMDIVDMAPYPSSGIDGQIHMIKLNNYCNSDDALIFHHWKASGPY